MTTFILVPGAWHGGWWYQPVVDALVADGHEAHALTPAGLGPDDDLREMVVNLDTHIDETVAAVERATNGPASDGLASDERVVLVGHSYGGFLITAAADRLPERVAALVHLDTDVPDDGDSTWSMTTVANRQSYIDGVGGDGLGIAPLPFFDERARPHPLATLVQRIRLTGAWKRVPVKLYAAATETPGGLQAPVTMEKLRDDPAWHYEEWPTRHNVLHDGPRRVLEFLGRA
ncbi:alpha/beta hydrolase [Actinoplanes sp. NPDC051494]|uniref:alpha/beta hydrolase n=1 Tax=Actinoplanes sp. NPDC051494 TaxID=3363907 RepID=UPI0037B53DB4